MGEDSTPTVFVSHTEADRQIADALSTAIERLFVNKVSVSYSTRRGSDGAIRAGENWFRWIGEQVRTSRVTVVLLTPNSVSKPWLLWEAGAVYGAALAQGHEQALPVRPLLYHLDSADIPKPMHAANLQALHGDDATDIAQFLTELISDIDVLTSDQKVAAGQALTSTIEAYLQKVEDALAAEPPSLEEPDIREWPVLEKTLELTITSLQALYPRAKVNGRYFHAIHRAGRDILVRADDLYVESEWMEEFGLREVDVELDLDTLVICQSFKSRRPLYKELRPDDVPDYRPELKGHIDPSQGWVLACPVIMNDAKPAGVLCLYGKRAPVRSEANSGRLKKVVVILSEVFAQTFEIEARLRGARSN